VGGLSAKHHQVLASFFAADKFFGGNSSWVATPAADHCRDALFQMQVPWTQERASVIDAEPVPEQYWSFGITTRQARSCMTMAAIPAPLQELGFSPGKSGRMVAIRPAWSTPARATVMPPVR
jgi:hypothetical protein